MMTRKHSPAFKSLALLLTAAMLAALLLGCGQTDNGASTASAGQRLLISAAASDADEDYRGYDTGDGEFQGSVWYNGLADVSITLDGQQVELETALMDGSVSLEELYAWAQIDARSGVCRELSNSINGLAIHVYRYGDYDVKIINDLYETPDGSQYPISTFQLYKAGTAAADSVPTFLPEGAGPGARIDREDWGLELTVAGCTAGSVTLHCVQSGGQQIGQLRTGEYQLISMEQDVLYSTAAYAMATLTMGGEKDFTLDWSSDLGELEAGVYILRLYIDDIYDPEDVHPLMNNYYDRQIYDVAFTVTGS